MMQRWIKWERQRWRLSEMRLLFMAVLVSVVVVTAVGFFADRVERLMRQQAVALMGGDLVLNSTRPINPAYTQQAQKNKIKTAQMVKFVSMTSSADEFKMAQIKAANTMYPLKGDIRVRDLQGAERIVTHIPKPNNVWVDPALLQALQLKVGDSLQLGAHSFYISHALLQEPDRGSSFMQIAPVIMMNLEDVERTGLLAQGSRARYAQYFTGSESNIEQLQTWLKPRLSVGENIRSLDDGLPTVQQALQRATRFLSLAALLSVVLAGAAIALTSMSLVKREINQVAVLKALGQISCELLLRQGFSLLVLAIVAAIVGSVLGFALQWGLAGYLADLIGETLPSASLKPVMLGFATAVLLLLGFAVPYIWQLTQTPSIQIFRQQLLQNTKQRWLWQGVALIPSLFVLFYLQAQDVGLVLALLASLLVGILFFWGVSSLVLRGLARMSLSVPLFTVFRGARRSVLLLVVFAIAFFSLLLLSSVRMDLLDRWQAVLPDNAPNHFMINIQPHEREQIEQYFAQQQWQGQFYPMMRARLVAVNDQPISANDFESPRAQGLLRREFNMSAFDTFPNSNILLEGSWFNKDTTSGFSIEQEVGETLGFGLGDRLRFDIAGNVLEQTITSVREVKWESMQPNFYVIASPAILKQQAHTYITSVHIPSAQKDQLNQLLKQYPSVTVIDVSAILQQVRGLIEKASFAVQGIALFTLITGVIVLMAALQSQQAERRRDIAILKSLGATKRQLRQRILLEFATIGGLAGVLAGVLASSAGIGLGYFLFDLDIYLNVYPIVLGSVLGALLVGSVAYFNLNRLLTIPASHLFRM